MNFRKYVFISSIAVVLIAFAAVATPAQRTTGGKLPDDRPPVIVRHYYYYDPFAWDRYNDFYYDRYMSDPYYRERREYYSLRSEVRDARSDLNESLAEYRADGVITPDEREELDEDYEELNDALRKLDEFELDG